ncbi:hypothetical protein [Orientia tsutsugamushi]|uniref:hypothetical protein n=1 Tax=Orientia tsutsugamushi TaxID=784 RepID=UPI000D5A53B2|nr:conjugal transfer protein TraI [Orientia tsutsugamushi]
MPEIKLNLKANLLRLFRYLSAIILHYLNQFRKKSNVLKTQELYAVRNIISPEIRKLNRLLSKLDNDVEWCYKYVI